MSWNGLYAIVALSPHARADITNRVNDRALAVPGIKAVWFAEDLPGARFWTDRVPLLAGDQVEYVGQPVALILGTSDSACRDAARKLEISYHPLPEVLDVEHAAAIGWFHGQAQSRRIGVPATETGKTVSGTIQTPNQSHLYLTPQFAVASPTPDGLKIEVETEDPDGLRAVVAAYLRLTENRIQIENSMESSNLRGKERNGQPWAILASLAAQRFGRSVQLQLSSAEDEAVHGGRSEFIATYEANLDREGRLSAIRLKVLANGGAFDLLGPGNLQGMLAHFPGEDEKIAWQIEAQLCKTNRPPTAPMIGGGLAETTALLEEIRQQLADSEGVSGTFRGGLETDETFLRMIRLSEYDDRLLLKEAWNLSHPDRKRGIALLPVSLDHATTLASDYATVLLNICADNSVQLHVPGGRSDFTFLARVRQLVIEQLGVSPGSITLHPASLAGLTNPVPAIPSVEHGLVLRAARDACEMIKKQLVEGKMPLTAVGQAAPDANALPLKAVGFAEVERDCLTEEVLIRKVHLLVDRIGASCRNLDEALIESGFRLGVGWLTREGLVAGTRGMTIGDLPLDLRITALEEESGPEQFLLGGNFAQLGSALAVAVRSAIHDAQKG